MIMFFSGKSSLYTSSLDRIYSAAVHRLKTQGDASSGRDGGKGVFVMPEIDGLGIHKFCSWLNTTPSINVSVGVSSSRVSSDKRGDISGIQREQPI
jgi:hypothetical protein